MATQGRTDVIASNVRNRIVLATLLAAALAVAGCGKSSEPPPPEPSMGQAPAEGTSGSFPTLSESATQSPLPPGHPPLEGSQGAGAQGSIASPPAGTGTGQTGMTWSAPTGWVSEPPSNTMRKAQYRIPGPGGDAECVVFYFGPGQGGDPMSNATRWAEQFRPPGGKTATDVMKTSRMQIGEVKVLVVETSGTYLGGQTMSMEPSPEKPGYALLGAVAEGPDANWFFKLTGPEKTVQANREPFEALLKSLKRGS
jgi:hypothetical protein